MRMRNPFVALLLIIVALAALTMLFTVGLILFVALAGTAVLLTAGMVIRRKFGRGRGALPDSGFARARLDPSMEVRPDQHQISSTTAPPPHLAPRD